MASIILISIFVSCVLYFFYKYATDRPEKFPPGPPRIPIFGSYLFLLMINSKWLHKGALLVSKLYKSDIIGLYLGPYLAVVVNSHEGVREVLFRQEFDGRPDIFLARLREPNYKRKGIIFNDGSIWKEQKHFILRHLHDYGFSKRSENLEIVIKEELLDLIDQITNGPKYSHENEIIKKGQGLCPYFLSGTVINSFLYIICGERLSRDEQKILLELSKAGITFQRTAHSYGRLLSILPWIRNWFPNESGFKPLRESNQFMYEFFNELVDKNLKSYDENYERHFLDFYIKEMKKAKNNEEDTTFLYDQFISSLLDFGFPAFSAIESQVSLLLQWFLIRPDIFEKVQKEIDKVVGRGHLPTLDDRKNLPYTEATLRECMRLETLQPSGIPHSALTDTDLLGYRIPKNCVVVTALHAFHLDKKLWGDPENFRPERFLDENGNLSLKKDITLPFGGGKRVCAAETFARNMMFLIVAALCQNFNVVLGPNEKPPDMSQNICGIIVTPKDFWVRLEAR